jgi:type I restriction enzyme, R subunit
LLPLPVGEGWGEGLVLITTDSLGLFVAIATPFIPKYSRRPITIRIRMQPMKRVRHYRAGFQFAGLTQHSRELRLAQTAAEAKLWSLLRNKQLRGFKFRGQHQFGNYIADFYCHEAQLVRGMRWVSA